MSNEIELKTYITAKLNDTLLKMSLKLAIMLNYLYKKNIFYSNEYISDHYSSRR